MGQFINLFVFKEYFIQSQYPKYFKISFEVPTQSASESSFEKYDF